MTARSFKTLGAFAALALLAGLASAGWDEGVAAFKSGNLSQAATEFKAVADSQPDWPGGHKMLGLTYLKMKRANDAVAALKKAYDLSPEDPSIQIYLGEAYIATGRYGDAAAFLSKVSDAGLNAQQKGYLSRLRATALTKSGQGDRALAEFRKAVQASPNDADLQYQYGTAAYNAGDTNTAVGALGKAAQLDPGDAAKQKAYAQALIRQGRLSQGNAKIAAYQKAIDAAQKVVGKDSSFENLELLAGAQMGAKRYDDAIATLQRAAAKKPNDWLPHYDIGRAYIGKGQARSAESHFRSALDRANSADSKKQIWGQLAYAYEKQKKFADAIMAYNQAGDSAGAERARENKEIADFNLEVEAEAQEIKKLQEEQEEIRKQLEELPGGPPPGR